MQIIGQRYTSPTVASLILSLESVFAVLFGWLLLHEALSGRELAGCALMFAAIVLAQLPFHSRGNWNRVRQTPSMQDAAQTLGGVFCRWMPGWMENGRENTGIIEKNNK